MHIMFALKNDACNSREIIHLMYKVRWWNA